jgi:hypothetical protein
VLGRGELRIIEGTDHITTLAKPEFASAVMEFLRFGKLNESGGFERADGVRNPGLRRGVGCCSGADVPQFIKKYN